MNPSRELRHLVLGFFHDYFSNSDPVALDLISKSDSTVLIGTDPDEVYVRGPEIRAILRTQQAEWSGRIKVESERILAFEDGNVGWASKEFTWTFVDARRSPLGPRWSLVAKTAIGRSCSFTRRLAAQTSMSPGSR